MESASRVGPLIKKKKLGYCFGMDDITNGYYQGDGKILIDTAKHEPIHEDMEVTLIFNFLNNKKKIAFIKTK